MEKYRKFADEATGNHPFLKHPLNKPSGAAKILYFTLGLILAIFRAIILVVLGIVNIIGGGMFLPSIILKVMGVSAKRKGDSIEGDKRLVLVNNSSPLDVMIIRVLFGESLWRVDMNSKVRSGAPGRILVSRMSGLGIFSSLTSFLPNEIASESDKYLTIEQALNQHKTVFLFYEGARSNNHSTLLPTDDLVTDLMSAYLKQKVAVYTCRITYTLGNVAYPANTTNSPLGHFLSLLLNPSMSAIVKVDRLPDSALTLRSSILPGLEKLLVPDKVSAYLARRQHKDYKEFLEYFAQTKVDDYTKDK